MLKKYYPDFEDLEISNENIYRKLYKQDKVVMGTMYFLISEMESLLEKFIGLENLNPVTLDLHFLEAMNRKGLQNAYGIKHNEIKKKLKDNSELNDYLDSNLSDIHTYSFIHIKPAVKMLQLMIYYELKLFSEAEDAANSFMQFLRNDKMLTSAPKNSYRNFVKNYIKLMKVEKIHVYRKCMTFRHL